MRKNRKNNSHTYRKRICIMAVLLAGSLMLGGCGVKKEKAADDELPEIVIGMDYFEPYSYQVSNGEYKGIDVELAKEAFQRLGYQPKFENIVWEDKDELLADGINTSRRMEKISISKNESYRIPNLDFDNPPVGIDILKVVESGILPVIDGGMIDKNGGWLGAGYACIPMECFVKASKKFKEVYGIV